MSEEETSPELSNYDALNKSSRYDFSLVAMDFLSCTLSNCAENNDIRSVLAVEHKMVILLCRYLEYHQENKIEYNDIINALLQLMSNIIFRCVIAQVTFYSHIAVFWLVCS